MSNRSELSRRSLFRVVGGVGASFALAGFSAVACATPGLPGVDAGTDKKAARAAFVPNAYIKIDPDGFATVTISRSDMGQGIRTSFAMLVAEELDINWEKVRVVQAEANSKLFRGQGTGGSSSIRSMHSQLRQVGAAARSMLVAAAARQWGVDPSACHTEDGKVVLTAGGKSIPYGELTALAAAETPPDVAVSLKDPSKFKIVGKPTNRVDNKAVVRGTAIYGLDVKVDGMAFAVVARPPAYGASIKTVDDAAARKVPGVIDVQRFDNSVAVIGTNTWAALSGRDALKIDYDLGPNAELTSAKITETLKATIVAHQPMPDGAKVVEATFDLPYLAHATMEPQNAVADVKADKCTFWAPTQAPDGAQRTIARMLNIPVDSVTVHTTLLGGGFGRRFQTDFVHEAITISKLMKRPIKLTWTREDDMKNDFYRPACHASLKGAVDAMGKPVAWSHQSVQAGGGPASGFGDAGLSYDIPKAGLMFGGARVPIPTGPWRSVENTLLNVVNECFMDELAHAAGQDSFEFRRKLIKNDRLRNVLELAAKNAGWGTPLPTGHGRGIACFDGYGSCVAHVVELSVAEGKIKLHRVVAVVDCGMAINPKGVEAQLQGAISDGLSTALRAEITIDKGGVVQNSWTDYKWMTMDAMPKIEVTILATGGDPGGMGEVGYPSVPPAVANAIFAATGKRVRKFPIKIEELA